MANIKKIDNNTAEDVEQSEISYIAGGTVSLITGRKYVRGSLSIYNVHFTANSGDHTGIFM